LKKTPNNLLPLVSPKNKLVMVRRSVRQIVELLKRLWQSITWALSLTYRKIRTWRKPQRPPSKTPHEKQPPLRLRLGVGKNEIEIKVTWLFLFILVLLLLIPAKVSAQSISPSEDVKVLLYPELIEPVEPVKPIEPIKPEPPKPVIYTVLPGDSLTQIAKIHNVEWQRLWAKNTQLVSPDILNIGEQITIPFPDEVLTREVPVSSLPSSTPGVVSNWVYTAGNTYSYGYCTAFVKDSLGWVRNGWGNAADWAWHARAQGFTVSSTPRVGAVAQTSAGWAGHVAVVIGIGDGTVRIREMNGPGGWNVITERVTSVSDWVYIYP